MGALKPRKGYEVSIPAIAGVKKRYKDIKYYIVGGSPPKLYLDLVKKYNLEKNVEFSENLPDDELIKIYYQADIFLLTPVTFNDNDFEGFGLVYLEAGACEKPVIGTYDCGAEDAIIDNITGLLIPQKDIKKTTEAMRRCDQGCFKLDRPIPDTVEACCLLVTKIRGRYRYPRFLLVA